MHCQVRPEKRARVDGAPPRVTLASWRWTGSRSRPPDNRRAAPADFGEPAAILLAGLADESGTSLGPSFVAPLPNPPPTREREVVPQCWLNCCSRDYPGGLGAALRGRPGLQQPLL